MRVDLGEQPRELVRLVLAPDLPPAQEEELLAA